MSHSVQPHPLCRHTASRGFTLIETIIVVVVLAIAAVTVAIQSNHILDDDAYNKDVQIALQLTQECTEHILASRRAAASLAAFTPSCPSGTLPVFSGFSAPSLIVTSITNGTNGCPSGGTCKLVTVSVSPITPVTLLLVGP